jgi:asparagine synthase (glutamine-hydrolysing)
MGHDAAAEALRAFSVEEWVTGMSGPLASDNRLALAQIEATTYLRNQLLRDSDWASMDHSVELRTPLVDAHLLKQLQTLLPAFARFSNKTLLSQSPERPLPKEVTARAKTGFGIPLGQWLGTQRSGSAGVTSREWARELVQRYEESRP